MTPPTGRRRLLTTGSVATGLAVLLVLVAAVLMRPLDNPDTFFHLRIGDELLSGRWSLTHPGHFSRFSTNDWVSTQWLSQLLLAGAERAGGAAGVIGVATAAALLLVATLWSSARRRSSAWVSLALVAVAVLALHPYLSPRPQLASYVLLAVTTSAWLRTAEDGRARWWLVPLTWLWAMLHGMWPAALLAGVASVLGQAIDQGPARFRLLWVPAASAVAAALTPLGPRLYAEIVLVGQQSRFFGEWAAPQLLSVKSLPVLLLAGVALVATLMRRPPWSTVALLATAALWLCWSWRTQPAAAAMLVPLAAAALGPLLPREPGTERRDRLAGGALAALVAVAATLALVVLPTRTAEDPRSLDTLLEQVPQDAVVVTDWGWGGYVAWARPDVQPTMHGYGDMFTVAELRRNDDLGALEPGWDRDLEDTGARLALLRSDERLAHALERHLGWRVEGRAGDWVLLRAP